METPTIRQVGIRQVSFGKNVVVIEPANLYECTVGDECFIGPFTEIQRGVIVGKRTRIQSHTFVCELVTIGDDCFIAHGVMFINDTFAGGAPSRSPQDWRATQIGNHVSIGSNATILPVRICDHVIIGAGAVVTKSIDRPGTYGGNPARPISVR